MNTHSSSLRVIEKARALRHARRRRGDSLIEVMAALVILAIGVLGTSSMQIATSRSNRDAFETTAATNFARVWLERVKRDALAWTQAGNPVTTQITQGRTVPDPDYFRPVLESAPTWTVPAPLYAGESAGANGRGMDVGAIDPITNVPVGVAETYYCVNLRFVVDANDSMGNADAIRVVARVWWIRGETAPVASYQPLVAARTANGCAGVMPNATQLSQRNMRVVYQDAYITWTPPS